MTKTRRETLQMLGAGALALLLDGCARACNAVLSDLTPVAPWRAGDPPVLVVGAGVAGLAAAQALRSAGVDAVVLEARARLRSADSLSRQRGRGRVASHFMRGHPLRRPAR